MMIPANDFCVPVSYTTIPLDPNQRDNAMELITELVEYSQTEAGTIRYRAMTDITDPAVVQFFEQYEDAAAAEAHTESDTYRKFVTSLPELTDGEIETIQFTIDEVEHATFTASDAIDALD